MTDASASKAIIYTASSSLKGVMRDGLRQAHVVETLALEKPNDVCKELRENANAWLLIDFAATPENFNKVLQAAQGPSAVETRPIYVIGSEVNANILVSSIEYNVGKIRLGTFTPTEINKDISELAKTYFGEAAIRAAMGAVHRLVNEGNTEGAGKALRELAEAHSEDPRVLCEYIDFLIQTNCLEDAMTTIEKVESVEPDYLRLQHLKARCLMKMKQYDNAISILKSAEKTNPWNAGRLIEFGSALLATARYREAKDKFEQILTIDPDHPQAKSGKTQALLLSGDIDEGLQHLRTLGSPRQIAATLNAAAVMAARTERIDDARELYTKGIQLLGEDKKSTSRIWFNLGILEFRAKKLQRALKCFETSSALDPKFKDATYNAKIIRKMLTTAGTDGAKAAKDIQSTEVSLAHKLLDT